MKRRLGARRTRAFLAVAFRAGAVAAAASLAVVLGAWAALAHVAPYVRDHDYFRLRSIRIACDEPRVEPRTVAELAGLYDGVRLWDIDPARIAGSLGDQSWVRSAEVSRRFPWHVSVEVSRRRAAAATVAEGEVYLVDDDGVLFREFAAAPIADLPYLTGWDEAPVQAERAARLRSLLAVEDVAAARGVAVSELHIDVDGTVWLYGATAKAAVRLGPAASAEAAFDRLAVALNELGPLADRARLIDVDYPDRIVVRGADDKLPALMLARSERPSAPRAAATGDSTHG